MHKYEVYSASGTLLRIEWFESDSKGEHLFAEMCEVRAGCGLPGVVPSDIVVLRSDPSRVIPYLVNSVQLDYFDRSGNYYSTAMLKVPQAATPLEIIRMVKAQYKEDRLPGFFRPGTSVLIRLAETHLVTKETL